MRVFLVAVFFCACGHAPPTPPPPPKTPETAVAPEGDHDNITCYKYFDGCNVCTVDAELKTTCTTKYCFPSTKQPPRCMDSDDQH